MINSRPKAQGIGREKFVRTGRGREKERSEVGMEDGRRCMQTGRG